MTCAPDQGARSPLGDPSEVEPLELGTHIRGQGARLKADSDPRGPEWDPRPGLSRKHPREALAAGPCIMMETPAACLRGEGGPMFSLAISVAGQGKLFCCEMCLRGETPVWGGSRQGREVSGALASAVKAS